MTECPLYGTSRRPRGGVGRGAPLYLGSKSFSASGTALSLRGKLFTPLSFKNAHSMGPQQGRAGAWGAEPHFALTVNPSPLWEQPLPSAGDFLPLYLSQNAHSMGPQQSRRGAGALTIDCKFLYRRGNSTSPTREHLLRNSLASIAHSSTRREASVPSTIGNHLLLSRTAMHACHAR